jgi:hypothetical protein
VRYYRSAQLFLLMAALACMVSTAEAQAPEKHPGMGYRGWIFDGLSYREIFAPEQTPTLYVLADSPSALSAHRTLVYYWPLTGHFLADWSGMNEALTGHLEVAQAGRVVATIQPTLFSLVRPDIDTPTPTISLVTGTDAEQQYAHYQAQLETYLKNLDSYSYEQAAYEARLQEAMKEIGAGKKDVVVPVSPSEPRQPVLFVTEPARAFVLKLPEGRYTIQLRGPDDQVVPGSRRSVVAFQPQQESISYTVIPENKWTQPEQSNSPEDDLYVAEPGVLYLQPRVVREYNEAFYRKLKDPQDNQGRDDRWIWVQQELVRGGSLEVIKEGQPVTSVSERPYWVEQVSGATLGYNIIEYEPDQAVEEKPTFRAYRLEPESLGPGTRIYFRDTQDQIVDGSQRDIHLLNGKRGPWLYLPAFLPLLPAILLRARRQAIRAHP